MMMSNNNGSSCIWSHCTWGFLLESLKWSWILSSKSGCCRSPIVLLLTRSCLCALVRTFVCVRLWWHVPGTRGHSLEPRTKEFPRRGPACRWGHALDWIPTLVHFTRRGHECYDVRSVSSWTLTPQSRHPLSPPNVSPPTSSSDRNKGSKRRARVVLPTPPQQLRVVRGPSVWRTGISFILTSSGDQNQNRVYSAVGV